MGQAVRIWRGDGWCVERIGADFDVVRGNRHMGTATPRPDGWRVLPTADAASEPGLAPRLADALIGLGMPPDAADAAFRALGGEPPRIPQDNARATAPHTGTPASNN
jgi:hypothetical protein